MTDIYQIEAPIYIPERRDQLARLLRESLGATQTELLEALTGFLDLPEADAFLHLEMSVLRLFQLASSHVVAGVLCLLHRDASWTEASVIEVRAADRRPSRLRGLRETPIRFLGGARLRVETVYAIEDRRGRRGRCRGVGRRQASGSGSYPLLEVLGITQHATPALRSEVARQTVRGASFVEARDALAERGIELNEKTVRALALGVGTQALDQRQARLDAAREGRIQGDEFAGKRIVMSVDGGRVRLREGGRRGRRGKKGHRRYATPWREPKLLAVYVIDKKGKKVADLPALYDGTLGDADATFEILAAELKLRGAGDAKEIILTGDGAPWIWNRADALAESLGLNPKKIVRVADFYHAVEHLTAIAELCASWSPARRKRWVCRMRRQLKAGRVDVVIQTARDLCKGRNSVRIRTEVDYFVERKDRMRYSAFRRRGIPLGSGAVESAIRRVINLRMKGPSIFWRGPNAERMLHMRAYFKAGRWDELMRRVMHGSPDGVSRYATRGKAA
jgi:hypothetical protein